MLPTRPDGPVGSMRESRFGQSLGWDFFCYSCSTPVSRKPGPDNKRSSADVSAGDESDVRCVRSQASLAVILLEPPPPKVWSGQSHKKGDTSHPPSITPSSTHKGRMPAQGHASPRPELGLGASQRRYGSPPRPPPLVLETSDLRRGISREAVMRPTLETRDSGHHRVPSFGVEHLQTLSTGARRTRRNIDQISFNRFAPLQQTTEVCHEQQKPNAPHQPHEHQRLVQ